jgi:hypothetical protein
LLVVVVAELPPFRYTVRLVVDVRTPARCIHAFAVVLDVELTTFDVPVLVIDCNCA